MRGYGISSDSNHITAPHESGDGARRAMQSAVAQSGLALSDIGYINAHATSTPLGDRAENTAVKKLFGQHANRLGISSTKVRTYLIFASDTNSDATFLVLLLTHYPIRVHCAVIRELLVTC